MCSIHEMVEAILDVEKNLEDLKRVNGFTERAEGDVCFKECIDLYRECEGAETDMCDCQHIYSAERLIRLIKQHLLSHSHSH